MKPHPLLVLALVSLAIRLPYFFVDVIDWDESTFILMGQSILDGNLPYVTLWDNKPPLCFALFAGFIAVFGKSIVSIRIAGWLCVLACSTLVYIIGCRAGGKRLGVLAGLLCVAFVSFASRGQATMSEIVAITPMTAGMALLMLRAPRPGMLILAGVCLSAAALVRLNLAFLAAVVGLWLIADRSRRPSSRVQPAHIASFTLGAAIPFVATAVPYIATGHLRTWMASVFTAPLFYAVGGISAALSTAWPSPAATKADDEQPSNTTRQSRSRRGRLRELWLQQSIERRRINSWLAVGVLGVVLSVFLSGRTSPHYWIQVHPLSALVAAQLGMLAWSAATWRWQRRVMIGVVAGAALAVSISSAQAYASMWRNTRGFSGGPPVVYGQATRIAAYLDTHNPERQPVYLMTGHIAYWFLGQQPLTRASTHPSVVFKEPLLRAFLGPDASSTGEMARILSKQPLYIVKAKVDSHHLRRSPDALRFLTEALQKHYRLETEFDGLHIYRRIQS